MPSSLTKPPADWSQIAQLWQIRADTVYLNHGSFGPSALPVRQARRNWIDRLDQQPMDFFVRQWEGLLLHARRQVADFVGTAVENLVFVENATFGMNVVADSFPLADGDQVLVNNHEYGAVQRIWDRACRRRGATLSVARLPDRFESADQVVQAIMEAAGDRTRLIIVSHITSPTALILPVRQLCAEARQRGIAVCVDGPHAAAQIPLAIDDLGCDFYTASCHKWLSAPFGSGFLVVAPRWQTAIEPQLKSWGRLLPAIPQRWDEEFGWSGTRDPSPYLTIPAAIGFLRDVGLDQFRQRCYQLARRAEAQLCDLLKTTPLAPDSANWYGTMAHVPLPNGDWVNLQRALWERYRIEVPIVDFAGCWYIRVSCHLYNTPEQIDQLTEALAALVAH